MTESKTLSQSKWKGRKNFQKKALRKIIKLSSNLFGYDVYYNGFKPLNPRYWIIKRVETLLWYRIFHKIVDMFGFLFKILKKILFPFTYLIFLLVTGVGAITGITGPVMTLAGHQMRRMKLSRAEEKDEAHGIVYNKVKPSYSISQLKDIMAFKKQEKEQEQTFTQQQIDSFNIVYGGIMFRLHRTATADFNEVGGTGMSRDYYVIDTTSHGNDEGEGYNFSVEITLKPFDFKVEGDRPQLSLEEKTYINTYPTKLVSSVVGMLPRFIVEKIEKQITKYKKESGEYDETVESIIESMVADYTSIRPVIIVPKLRGTPMSSEDMADTIIELDTWRVLGRNSLYNISKGDDSKKEETNKEESKTEDSQQRTEETNVPS